MSDSKPTSKMKFVRIESGLFQLQPYGTYYGMVKRQGKVIRESLKTDDFKLAKRLLIKFLDRVDRLKPGTGRLSFRDVAKVFKETVLAAADLKPRAREYREYCLENLFRKWPALETIPIKKIDRNGCERWFAHRREEVSAQLLNNELGTLKMIFEHAVREGVMMMNPAKELKRATIEETDLIIPTRDQFISLTTKLRQEVSSDAADFVEILAYSGMRRNEAATFTWEDIDWKRGQFKVTGGEQGTKNRQVRYVPLFPALRTILERLRCESSSGNVLPIKQCRDSIKAACTKAKIPHFNHHSMRHFFVSNAIEYGIDFKVIAAWVGHKDGGILVAKTYGHLRQQHSEAMAAKMTFDASTELLNGITPQRTVKT